MYRDLVRNLYSATTDITTGCNLQCKHCRLEKIPYHMSLEELEIICKKLQVYKTKILFVSGGEPLIRDDIIEVVRLIKKYIPLVTINTNATLLTKELLEQLIEAGVNYFQVSLDGLEMEHDQVRGMGTFKRTMNRIHMLADYSQYVKLHISSVVSMLNIDQMDRFVEYLVQEEKIPAEIIGFKRYLPKNVMAGRYNLGKEGLKKLYDNISRLEQTYSGKVRIVCDFPIKNVFQHEKVQTVMKKYDLKCAGCSAACGGPAIRADGSVSPCSLLDVSVGNLLVDSIEDIFNSEVFTKLVNRELIGKCGECKYRVTCGGCRAAAYLLCGDYLGEDLECFI